jgi:putative transposase
LSVPTGTMCRVTQDTAAPKREKAEQPPLVSHTGLPLTRPVTFRFTLDTTRQQHQMLLTHAGAFRKAFNHQIGRVKANLDQRAAERTYGIADADLTPSLSWSKISFINHMNAWKDGRAADAEVHVLDDGTVVRGLPWRDQVCADVFETASVNAAQALKNWTDSHSGARTGKAAGFPRFKSRHKTAPAFRLRSKSKPGQTSPVRPSGPRGMRFPKLGEIRVHEHTGRLARMLEGGRFHAYAAAFRFERGRWVVAVTGVAAQFHHQRRNHKNRHQPRVGVDLGVATLAVIADEHGRQLQAHRGVKALQHAQARLKLANQALSRTKKGSRGRAKAARRLGKIHARVAATRKHLLHQITTELARSYASVTIEDLNASGMLQLRSLARHLSDASFGQFRRQLEYKTAWYRTELVVADRWFPSSKTCSGCGSTDPDLALSDRVYACANCGLVVDRDLNAAVNLARYTAGQTAHSSPPRPAAA